MGSNFQPTVPRGPIAAMFPSPGPKYPLPALIGTHNHDFSSTHFKGPCYSFGGKHSSSTVAQSPGPCYYPDPSISRRGKDGAPKYTLSSRTKEWALDKTPGPGLYAPEKNNKIYKSPPAYSFGLKRSDKTTDVTPGSNSYLLPSVIGKCYQSNHRQAPAFSMTPKSKIGGFHHDLQNTPGPGAYNVTNPNLYKGKAPVYSMTSRNLMPSDTTQKPSPAAYYHQQLNAVKAAAPGYSFGIRHSPYIAPLMAETYD